MIKLTPILAIVLLTACVVLTRGEQVNYDLVKESNSQQQDGELSSSQKNSLLLRALRENRGRQQSSSSNDEEQTRQNSQVNNDYDGPSLYRDRSGLAILAMPIDEELFDELGEVNSMEKMRMADKRSVTDDVHFEAKKKKYEEMIRNRNASAQLMEKKLTEKQKKLITDAITTNLLDKLKNMYVVTARSRFGKRSVDRANSLNNKRKRRFVIN